LLFELSTAASYPAHHATTQLRQDDGLRAPYRRYHRTASTITSAGTGTLQNRTWAPAFELDNGASAYLPELAIDQRVKP
jgi:hypothetical protein